MVPKFNHSICALQTFRFRFVFAVLTACLQVFSVTGRASAQENNDNRTDGIYETASLVAEVKAFGRSLGIEPTEALTKTALEQQPRSMLWLWLQRAGTLALRAPIDLRLFLSFAADKKTVALEHVYRVEGYSVYFRQGDEFADAGSVVTQKFSQEDLLRRVQVILHEDLHGERNFALPWELEESIVTPLGAMATVEFFRRKGDNVNMTRALRAFARERVMAQEILELTERSLKLFREVPLDDARREILALLQFYPNYQRAFTSQTQHQDAASVLEAKISHDLVYYRYFDRIAAVAEIAPDLRTLILAFKQMPRDATIQSFDAFLNDLTSRYQPTE